MGVSSDLPGKYTGQFYERNITLNGPQTVDMAAEPPLPVQNITRVTILPIRTTVHGAGGPENVGVLRHSDIVSMQSIANATRDGYIEPFSYGITSWQISVQPVVEELVLRRPATEAPDTESLLTAANLQGLKAAHDIVLFLYSAHTATGEPVADNPCCFWALGQSIMIGSHLTRNWPASDPNYFLLHEALHSYESYNEWHLGRYSGVLGVHGAEAHGYRFGRDGDVDLVPYYRLFMRGQIAEPRKSPLTPSGSNSLSADLFVGIFDTMRKGMKWPIAESPRRARAAATSAEIKL
jgi:hypothetical protein